MEAVPPLAIIGLLFGGVMSYGYSKYKERPLRLDPRVKPPLPSWHPGYLHIDRGNHLQRMQNYEDYLGMTLCDSSRPDNIDIFYEFQRIYANIDDHDKAVDRAFAPGIIRSRQQYLEFSHKAKTIRERNMILLEHFEEQQRLKKAQQRA